MRRTRRKTFIVIKRLPHRLRRLSEEDTEEIAIGGPPEPDAGNEAVIEGEGGPPR
jgi:hypothetical protein